MKLARRRSPASAPGVTPFTGVWIEMPAMVGRGDSISVTPFTGVWIEMMQERVDETCSALVTPFTGVLIEMEY